MAATASCVMRIAAQKCRGLQPYCASRGGLPPVSKVTMQKKIHTKSMLTFENKSNFQHSVIIGHHSRRAGHGW